MKQKISNRISHIKNGNLWEKWKQVKWIYQYGKKHWPAMIFYTLLGMTGTVVSLISSLISKDLVDIITGYETGRLVTTFCMMIGINVGTTLINQVSNYVSTRINLRVDAEIKADIFSKILVTDWEALTGYHTGDLLTRWSSDAGTISTGVLNFVPHLIIYVFRFISAFAMVIYYDASFAIFAFLSMPVSLIMSRTLMRRMTNNNQRSAAMGAKMTGFNQEAFSNIQEIKAFDLVGLYIQRLKSLQKEYITMKLDFQKMSIGTSILLNTVGLVVSYASYGWGIYRVWSGAISYGTMTMFLGLSGTLTGTLNGLTSLVPTAIRLTTSAGRLMDIVEMPREDYSHDEEVQSFWEKNKAQGISLKLEDVSYAYQNGTEVFEGASIEVNPKEIIALVGPSGEGKTTMLRLILSLMRTGDGKAYLEGATELEAELAAVQIAGNDEEVANRVFLTPSTRKLFSYVPQGNTMFSGTIAENMRNVKPEATEEEIINALKEACAWEFVEKLPGGIHSEIKERGGGFSEGQAQRLSIARALLRDAPILLLDEATSALDVATERKVLRNIMNNERPRTCIVTTHRPTVLSACTRVYAIRDKKCVVLNEEEIEEMVKGF
ncbi:MAG: ABC transporter ATP-binding protein [Lachnospiraceae bacterium]|nr:ABC transporter ATP-binding protein [Lachnospiraceae bacterium]